jgi:hypothetical protein
MAQPEQSGATTRRRWAMVTIKQERTSVATLPSTSEKARMALRVFQHFGSRPREVLRLDSFLGFAATHGWSPENIAEGLQDGRDLAWFEDGPEGSTRLTAAGYAEIVRAPAQRTADAHGGPKWS